MLTPKITLVRWVQSIKHESLNHFIVFGEDHKIVGRARRLRNFLTQPFFVAETFTGMAGRRVELQQAIDGVSAILEGKCDGLREEALFMIGALEEALAQPYPVSTPSDL